LLEVEFIIADTIRDHSRKPLGILDIMSALGGFERNLSLLGMMMVKAISSNAFFLKAIQKLYLVRTSDDSLFGPRKNQHINDKLNKTKRMIKEEPSEKKESILKNRFIKYSSCQFILLYL